MNNLTAEELSVLNNLSRVLNPSVSLGAKLQEMIGVLGEEGTPVNAVAATGTLDITGVVIDGETVTINNPAVSGTDVYEFLADTAQTKTAASNIAVNITENTVKAFGTLTMDTQPTSGDTVTIGAKTYIFVPVGTANGVGEVSIGATLAGAQAALVAAINGTDGVNTAHTLVRAGAFSANASTITAFVGGTTGNVIATTETFTAGTNIFAAATLGSGADCTAANAVTALVAAITTSDTQGVGAVDGAGDTVVITADIAGAGGNDIVLTETMANATLDAAKLSGGVDGTIASGTKFLMDATYLYVCLDGNTVAEKNWRRISIGAAY